MNKSYKISFLKHIDNENIHGKSNRKPVLLTPSALNSKWFFSFEKVRRAMDCWSLSPVVHVARGAFHITSHSIPYVVFDVWNFEVPMYGAYPDVPLGGHDVCQDFGRNLRGVSFFVWIFFSTRRRGSGWCLSLGACFEWSFRLFPARLALHRSLRWHSLRRTASHVISIFDSSL